MAEQVENFYAGVELCKQKDKGGCATDITITHCDFPNVVFSTKFNTLSFESFDGWEIDTKTKETIDKNKATHYEEITSIAWKTTIKFDACKAENKAFFDFIDENTFRSTGRKGRDFMNRFIVIETSYDEQGQAYTTRRVAIMLSYSGRNASDEENKNETEIEFHAYGDPQISTFIDPSWVGMESKIKVTFDLVAGATANGFRVDNAVIANTADLCDAKFPYKVQYYGLLEAKPGECKPEYFEVINESMIMLKDIATPTAITTTHEQANAQQTTVEFLTALVTANIYKVIAVVDFDGNGTLIKVGEKVVPATVVTP